MKMAIKEAIDLVSESKLSVYNSGFALNDISSDAQNTLLTLKSIKHKMLSSNEESKEDILKMIDELVESQNALLRKIPKQKEACEAMTQKLSKANGWLESTVEDVK